MKKLSLAISCILLFSVLMFQGCRAEDSDTAASNPSESAGSNPETVMSLDELSQYDGKDGNPAYIAVDGMIYDVTDVTQWTDGEHNGYSAGQDLTDEINNISPHGVSKLKNIPVVGTLED